MGVGYGIFVRLNFELPLKDNHLVNIGESFVVVNLVRESTDVNENYLDFNLPKLRLKLFGGPSTGEVYYFTGSESKITLGRMNDCSVQIEDGLLSKY